MGNRAHRIELLLIGMLMLLVGVVVGGTYLVHTYLLPLDPHEARVLVVTAGPQALAVVPTGVPTLLPTRTAQPSAVPTVAPSAVSTIAPHAVPTVVPVPARTWALPTLPTLALPFSVPFWVPGVLLIVGSLGMIAIYGRRIYRRRMPLTNQSVGLLLATASAETRAANLRVMENLHAQGLLTPDLQAQMTGTTPVVRRSVRLPTIQLPRITLPTIRLPRMSLPKRAAKPVAPVMPVAVVAPTPSAEATALVWTPQDRILAVMNQLHQVWMTENLRSSIRDLSTNINDGRYAVFVSIDYAVNEQTTLLALPATLNLVYPRWQVYWRSDALEVLVDTTVAPPSSAVAMVPLLTVGRKAGVGLVHYAPLMTWPHLGIYGPDAYSAAHAMLNHLLLSQAPENLAVTFLDSNELSVLYRDVPHRVEPFGNLDETIDQLLQVIKLGVVRDSGIRPLIVVVVNPHPDVFPLLSDLWARLRLARAPRMHLLLVASTPPALPDLVATLPALVTGGAPGGLSGLPGGDAWPKAGQARFVGRAFRRDGYPLLLDEATCASQMAVVAAHPHGTLDGVLWDGPSMWEAAPTPVSAPPLPVTMPTRTTAWATVAPEASAAHLPDVLPLVDGTLSRPEPRDAVPVSHPSVSRVDVAPSQPVQPQAAPVPRALVAEVIPPVDGALSHPALASAALVPLPSVSRVDVAPSQPVQPQAAPVPRDALADQERAPSQPVQASVAPVPAPYYTLSNLPTDEAPSPALNVARTGRVHDDDNVGTHAVPELPSHTDDKASLPSDENSDGEYIERAEVVTATMSGDDTPLRKRSRISMYIQGARESELSDSYQPPRRAVQVAPPTAMQVAPPPAPRATVVSWPAGPMQVSGATLRILWEKILSDPGIMQPARPDQGGLSKGRMTKQRVLPMNTADDIAEVLLPWFTAAGVVGPAHNLQKPFEGTRLLLITDMEQIAMALSATAFPPLENA